MALRIRQGSLTRRVQIVRTTYDKVKKRGVQKVVGSFPASVEILPENLSGKNSPLTEKEKKAAFEWIAQQVEYKKTGPYPDLCPSIIFKMEKLSSTLETSLAPSDFLVRNIDAGRLYGEIDRLKRALRKRGVTRPKGEPARRAK